MSMRALLIPVPDDWGDNTIELLAERLAHDELPSGLEVHACTWDTDDQAWSPWRIVETGR